MVYMDKDNGTRIDIEDSEIVIANVSNIIWKNEYLSLPTKESISLHRNTVERMKKEVIKKLERKWGEEIVSSNIVFEKQKQYVKVKTREMER